MIAAQGALEAFAYRYRPGESTQERFLVHRTVFPRDFLEEFGFFTLRAQGSVELCRLELGGLRAGRGGPPGEGAPGGAGRVLTGAGAQPARPVACAVSGSGRSRRR